MSEKNDHSTNDTYKKLFEESPVPMYIFDNENYRFLAVNNAALFQYGYSRQEFLSMTAIEIRPEEDVPLFEHTRKVLSEDYYDHGRWRHVRKNGEVFYVHIYARPTEYMGRKARIVLSVDVDKKVRSEKALAEKNKENMDILETITDGYYTVNQNWEITYFNRAAERILGIKREQVLGKVIWDLFPGTKRGKNYSKFLKAMEERQSAHFESHYEPLGLWAAINIYPAKDGLAVYFVDITEEKKTQEKIHIDEQNLRTIINNTDDLIWSVDLEHNIISANDAFWKRIEGIVGMQRPDKITPDMVGQENYVLWQGYFEKARQLGKYKVIADSVADGKPIIEETSFTPIYDKNHAVIGISCFSRDITEEMLHMRQVEQQNEQLQQIAWIQSHEVRGPVASIMGLSQLFNKQEANKTNAEIIEQIQHAAQKLDEIIRKINAHTSTSED